jgi:hypothetical protein
MSDAALIKAALKIWPFDNKPLHIDVEAGIVWAITPSPARGINAYALIPAEGHPWSKKFPNHIYPEQLIEIHGGISYAGHPWIGFDTGHACDCWPDEYNPRGIRQDYSGLTHHWTVNEVIDEAKQLARRIADIQSTQQM